MEKQLFAKDFMDKLDKNFQKQSKYFDCDFSVFKELEVTVFEINKCLILELYIASITMTNFLLERLLKLSLIYDEAGIEPIPDEDWNTTFEKAHEKYNQIDLSKSIKKCKCLGLLMEDEKIFLDDKIREQVRNGFSHADPSKILKGMPDKMPMVRGSFLNPTEFTTVYINGSINPITQGILIEKFAQANAAGYFDYVFELIKKMDQRLREKDRKKE